MKFLICVLLVICGGRSVLPAPVAAEVSAQEEPVNDDVEEVDEGLNIDDMIRNALPMAHDGDFIQSENGTRIFKVDMDMLFSEDDYAYLQENKLARNETETDNNCDEENRRMKRKATNYRSKRWTNGVIPYWTANHFGAAALAQIDASIREWNTKTCVNLRKWKSGDRNYIKLQNGGGCSSYVGMSGGGQVVTLASGCRIKRIIVHELGHAVGFQHEQTRPDRNNYVTIYHNNIYPGMAFNFDHYNSKIVNTYGVPYDYGSVMHYGATAFSRNGQYTIRTIDPKWQRAIGNAPGLSFNDLKLANLMYDCGGNCGNKKCPGTGYLDKHCKCQCNTGSASSPIAECAGDDGDDDDDDDDVNDKCVDKNTQCSQWKDDGHCDTGNAYMKENCKKSCKICTDGGGGGGANCKDISAKCPGWASRGECSKNPQYMLTYCKKSCNKCTGGGGGGSNCKDLNNYCSDWAKSKYCEKSIYKSYMKANCKKSCNYCSSSGDEVVVESDCKDHNQHCKSWASTGECTKNPAFMNVDCKKSCNKCSGGSDSDSGNNCKDNNAFCPAWASSGECTNNPGYMNVDCKKSCNKCSGGGVSYNPTCTNQQGDDYCEMYKGICQSNGSMETYCKKTCGFC